MRWLRAIPWVLLAWAAVTLVVTSCAPALAQVTADPELERLLEAAARMAQQTDPASGEFPWWQLVVAGAALALRGSVKDMVRMVELLQSRPLSVRVELVHPSAMTDSQTGQVRRTES